MSALDSSPMVSGRAGPISAAPKRPRRAHRPYLARRLAARSARLGIAEVRPSQPSSPRPVLTEQERSQRLQRVAHALVRTINSCPAPGVAPLSLRDWLLIGGAVLIPYLIVFGLAALASPG